MSIHIYHFDFNLVLKIELDLLLEDVCAFYKKDSVLNLQSIPFGIDRILKLLRESYLLNECISDKQNIILKIDLSAMLVLPIVVGLLMTSYGVLIGCLFVIGWHVGAFFVENKLNDDIYAAVPALAVKQTEKNAGIFSLRAILL